MKKTPRLLVKCSNAAKILLVFLCASTFLLLSCNKDENEVIVAPAPTTSSFTANFGASVNRDFIGQVLDDAANPIAGVAISIGSLTTQTDINGVFIIKNAAVQEKFAFVKASKIGFIDGSRTLVPTTGKNNITIVLIPNTPIQTIASGAPSTVTLPSGTQVKFDGAFVDAAGVAYSGPVAVSLYHLITSKTNINNIMPGSLLAQATDGSAKILETFGMLNVELKGSAGQKLNIAPGHSAQLSSVIDASQIATAPAIIPLWHFDEVGGYWKQEGSATKVGSKYEGTVSHFTWWNFDGNYDTSVLNLKVVNTIGDPIANVSIALVAGTSVSSSTNSTNSDGVVSGLVPANKSIVVKVFDACGVVIYTTTIPALATNANFTLPNIVISTSSSNVSTIKGVLQKCDGTSVTNGYVILGAGSTRQLAAVTSGNFTFNSMYCGSTSPNFTYVGYDNDAMQTTGVLTGIYTNPITNLGNILACTAVTQYISLQVDSGATKFLYTGLSARTPSGFPNTFQLGGSNGTDSFSMSGPNTVGIYTSSTSFYIESGLLIGTSAINANISNTMQYTVSSYGAVGQYVNVSMAGTYTAGGITHTLSGYMHVLRTL